MNQATNASQSQLALPEANHEVIQLLSAREVKVKELKAALAAAEAKVDCCDVVFVAARNGRQVKTQAHRTLFCIYPTSSIIISKN